MRLFKSEKRLTVLNLLTPVMKVSSTWASHALRVPYSPRRSVPIGLGDLRLVYRVQDRLVVLIHQHDHPPPAAAVQRFQQRGEASGQRAVVLERRRSPAA